MGRVQIPVNCSSDTGRGKGGTTAGVNRAGCAGARNARHPLCSARGSELGWGRETADGGHAGPGWTPRTNKPQQAVPELYLGQSPAPPLPDLFS
jgi:hypothetical protein